MKKIFVSLILLALAVTACAPPTPAVPPSIIINDPVRPTPSKPTPTSVPATEEKPLSSVEMAVVKQLAGNLGLNAKSVSLVSDKSVEFGDACLDISMPDMMCAQVITPGHMIVLQANGVQYEYHTDADGLQIQPTTFALTWKREGGIAGFCDNIIVFLSGEVYVSNCRGAGRMGTMAKLLSADKLKQFNAWISEFGQFELDASDPKGVADRMVVTLSFFGLSNGEPTTADKDAMFLWIQDLFQNMNSA